MNARRMVPVATLLMLCAVALSAHGAEKEPDGLYVLHIPGLGEDTVEHPNKKRHLMRLYGEGREHLLRRVFPDVTFREFTGWEDYWNQHLPPGLAFTGARTGDEGVTISGMIVGIPMYYSVTLEGQEGRAGSWEGEAIIKMFPYGHEWRGYMKSKWSLQPAPESFVYERMVAALDYLKHLAESKRAGLSTQELETRDDYVAFLRRQEWPFHERSLGWKPIDPEFQKAIADALEDGRIVIREGGFSPSEEVRKSFENEVPLVTVNTKVTTHGTVQREVKVLTEDERRLENLLRYEYRPPTTPYSIRRLATPPKVRTVTHSKKSRDERLANMGKEVARFVSEMDYSWDELQFIPGIAFLAEYVASVPQELQDRVAERYITDESGSFFPGMEWEWIARIPDPVLLMACLPRMKQTAERQAKQLSEILQEEGYTLQDLEDDKISIRTRMRMKDKHPRFTALRRRRIRVGQAEGLAETERVKRLLETSGLKIAEIDEYTIPELVTRILSPMSSEQAQSLVNETPKFKEYLRRTEDEGLRDLIKEKNLDVELDRTE
jgi:hypothetical protein